MLRQRVPVRAVTDAEQDAALDLCARDRATNVFVAARIREGAIRQSPGSLLGHYSDGVLDGLAWASANIVPVGLDDAGVADVAAKVTRMRRLCASIFGPRDQVTALWDHLSPSWGPARAIRRNQPLLSTTTRPSLLGVPVDPTVRVARPDEVDIVLPAAAHMFTEEIGYPPFQGSDRAYRSSISQLIRRRHTFVSVEHDEIVFKADVGSLAHGCAQVQGVWVHPELRGQGRAVPAMAAVVELILDELAEEVTLYVNDFNIPARATYARCGFREVGAFTTVLL